MEILCGGCRRQVEVAERLAGSDFQCRHCGRVIHVPALDEDGAAEDEQRLLTRLGAEDDLVDEFLTKAKLALRKKLLLVCGACGERLTVEQRLGGKVARCPSCGDQIRIPAAIDEEPIEPEELMTDVADAGRTLDAAEKAPSRPGPGPAETEQLAEAAAAGPHAPEARPLHPGPRPPASKRSPGVLVLAVMAVAVATGLGGILVGYRLARGRDVPGTGQQTAGPESPLKSERDPAVARGPETPAPVSDTRPSPVAPTTAGVVGPLASGPSEPKATKGLKALRARLSALAGDGRVPAPVNRQFLEVNVQIAAGTEPVTIDTVAGDVVVRAREGEFASIGTAPAAAYLPTPARAGKLTVPPTATRMETFLFLVPASISAGTLKIAGVGEAVLPGVEKFPAPPAAALVGTYAEAGRRLKLSFADPIMEQVRSAPEHKLVITAENKRFRIKVPPTGLTGSSIFQGQGTYTAVLTHAGKALPCQLRLLPGGKRLILYLAEKPYHQVIYDKR